MFEDEGHSGAALVRPALEALGDLIAEGCADVVLYYSPDWLARKFRAVACADLARTDESGEEAPSSSLTG